MSCLVCPVFGHGQDGQMSGLSGLSDRWVPTGQTGHLSKEMSGLSCPVGGALPMLEVAELHRVHFARQVLRVRSVLAAAEVRGET